MQGTVDQGTSLKRQAPEAEAPGSIILSGQVGVDPGLVIELLERAGLKGSAKPGSDSPSQTGPVAFHACEGLEDASRQLQDQPRAQLLLLYRDPVNQIAESVAAGVDPADAVVQWQQQADEILTAYRRARRRITLMEVSAALAEPNAMIRELNQHLGISLATLADSVQVEPEPDRDPVHVLIADRTLHQDTRARRTAAEFEASALPLTGNSGAAAIDLSATCQSYREIRNKELTGENQKLKAQAESEQQARSVQDELKEENELLLMQLHQVQEELESYFLENREINEKFAELEKKNQALMHEAHALRDTVKALYASISWKITAPLRAVLRPFKGK